jgi:pyruvate kinase
LITLDCQTPGIGGISDNKTFYANCDIIQRYLKPNDVVYIDDGKVIGVVLEVTNEGCLFEVKLGGVVKSFSQLRFVGGKHAGLPILHQKDIEDLTQISKVIPIDFIAMPFASNGEGIQKVRDIFGENGKQIAIIAKIDTIHGIENFDMILEKADGIIIQRNELQWEIPAEKLMIAQKFAIQQANKAAKFAMIQSQVLESMMLNGSPDRQEMTEITTATLDGADTFIVSHETSSGSNNISSVVNLAKAIAEAENIFDYEQAYVNMKTDTQKDGRLASNIDILMTSSCGIAFEKDADVDMFVCVTSSGKIANYLSKQRPRQPILACSTSGQVVRQANMVRGVVGYKIPEHLATKEEELLDLLLKVA